MNSAAVIVGIDSYQHQPLTSAVNDAVAFRDTVVDLGLIDAADVEIICSPPCEAGGRRATKQAILEALWPFYASERRADRLFFYYAGHGLLTYADAAHAESRTVIVPVDVEDLNRDGDALIDVDALLRRFRLAGPAQQFFFLDACRDMAFDGHPDVGRLGWAAVDAGAPRAQAILYAVAERGQALGRAGGHGVMSTHLNDALRGKGIALDYSDEEDAYVVTAQSVRAYVCKRVEAAISDHPLWRRRYMLPHLDSPDPQPGPIRTIATPPPADLTIHIAPDEAASNTTVVLAQRGNPLQGHSWPPHRNHLPVRVAPQRFTILASATDGEPDPPRLPIDAREQVEATIRVRSVDRPAVGVRRGLARRPRDPSIDVRRAPAPGPPGAGLLDARARQPETAVEVRALDPPYAQWSGRSRVRDWLPAGRYRVTFRLGADEFSSREVDVETGREVAVRPDGLRSALLRDVLARREPVRDVMLSEPMGSLEGAVLPTLLAIVGIAPFDAGREIARRLGRVVPRSDPGQAGERPVSVVVALDGDDWPAGVDGVLDGVRCALEPSRGHPHPVELRPLDGPPERYGRLRVGVAPAPGPSFFVRLDSAELGTVRLASAAVERRVTVAGFAFAGDGSLEISHNLLRFPGREYPEAPVPRIDRARLIRELQLAQQLYASGELLLARRRLVDDLLRAKWTDPLLSCMAFFAARDAEAAGEGDRVPDADLETAACNLVRYFGAVSDSRVVYALTFPDTAEESLGRILEAGDVPLLRRSALALAEHARARGVVGAGVLETVRRLAPDSIWSLEWTLPDP
jgi:hypothetical protein